MSTPAGGPLGALEKTYPQAFEFLSAWFADQDEEAPELTDREIVRNYVDTVTESTTAKVAEQIRAWAAREKLSHQDLADVTDLHFESESDAREWLSNIADSLES